MKNLVKQYRVKIGYKQSDLAQKANINRVTLAQIESGKTLPNGKTMLSISKALNVPVEEIFFN